MSSKHHQYINLPNQLWSWTSAFWCVSQNLSSNAKDQDFYSTFFSRKHFDLIFYFSCYFWWFSLCFWSAINFLSFSSSHISFSPCLLQLTLHYDSCQSLKTVCIDWLLFHLNHWYQHFIFSLLGSNFLDFSFLHSKEIK